MASEIELTALCYWPESGSSKPLIDVLSVNLCHNGTGTPHGIVSAVTPLHWPVVPFVEPYNASVGWYIAATLSTMVILFIVCISLDRLKRNYYVYRWRKRMRK